MSILETLELPGGGLKNKKEIDRILPFFYHCNAGLAR
jgi:hypothetical protein